MHLRQMISTFYKDYLETLTAILLLIDSALPMAKPIAKSIAKSINVTKKIPSQLAKAFVKQIREVL